MAVTALVWRDDAPTGSRARSLRLRARLARQAPLLVGALGIAVLVSAFSAFAALDARLVAEHERLQGAHQSLSGELEATHLTLAELRAGVADEKAELAVIDGALSDRTGLLG